MPSSTPSSPMACLQNAPHGAMHTVSTTSAGTNPNSGMQVDAETIQKVISQAHISQVSLYALGDVQRYNPIKDVLIVRFFRSQHRAASACILCTFAVACYIFESLIRMQLTRGLRARLAYAHYKVIHNVTPVKLSELESQSKAAAYGHTCNSHAKNSSHMHNLSSSFTRPESYHGDLATQGHSAVIPASAFHSALLHGATTTTPSHRDITEIYRTIHSHSWP